MGAPCPCRATPSIPSRAGVLCNKVNGYVEHSQSPERLLYPMRRVGPKGAGNFERISWDAALDEISERFEGTIQEFGAEAIWPYLGSGSMGLLQGVYAAGRRFWNVLGASRHLMTICTIAGGVGTGYTLGDNRVGMDPETLRFSKLIILWGSNTLTSNHHLWRSITTARRNGAYLVVIDPTRTRTAEAADSQLALIPGICGLSVDAIVELGRRIARTRPTAIRLTMGLQRHGGGGMAVRTITCIPGVTGDWRSPGGGVGYDTRGFFGVNGAALHRDDLRQADTRASAGRRSATHGRRSARCRRRRTSREL